MKYYFFENIVLGFDGETLPQGFPLVNSFSKRMDGCFPLTQEQTDYYLANLGAGILDTYYCGNVPQSQPTLPTLVERKTELIEKFAQMQKEVALLFLTAEKAVGAENTTLISLIEQARLQRAMTLQTIEGFTDIDVAMAFDIREEDCKPLKDALFNLINNVI